MNTIKYPRLRHFTMLANNDKEAMHIVVGTEHFELNELMGDRNSFLNMKRYFDGRHSIPEISSLANISVNDIDSVVTVFEELGIIRKEPLERTQTIPKNEFISRVNDTCVMWQRQIGYHRLFNLLSSKTLRKEVLIGLLLET